LNLRTAVYALSCSYLLLGSFLLILPLFFETKNEFDVIKKGLLANTFPVSMGVLGLFIAAMQLLLPYTKVPFIGDLLATITVIVVSITLVFSYVRFTRHLSNRMIQRGDSILSRLQIPVGFFGLGAFLIHLLFGSILFL
jgi:hypothetical protein